MSKSVIILLSFIFFIPLPSYGSDIHLQDSNEIVTDPPNTFRLHRKRSFAFSSRRHYERELGINLEKYFISYIRLRLIRSLQ